MGYGRNVAVRKSSGNWLCFQDIDDVMMPNRIQKQLEAGRQLGNNYVNVTNHFMDRFNNKRNIFPIDNWQQIFPSATRLNISVHKMG